ncbi:hypothetical protein [Shimia biformata]|uniref:hypothetical protein n=1 Tax=Shimia biformata TaxID=1294299 RepID=UPI00195020AB|nr:hypothetical protein [Shimia biformata]
MDFLRGILVCLLFVLGPGAAVADDRLVRLSAPDVLVQTGVLKFILPRFTLKNQVRVQLVDDPESADVVLGDDGRALFHGAGQTWHMALRNPDHPGVRKLADWLTSEVGQRTVMGFAPEGAALFGPPETSAEKTVALTFDGDPALGHVVSRQKCIRCHSVDDESRMSGIGSTPSFAVLRSLPDWEERFAVFYALNPHPSFTLIQDVTPPFPADRPSPIHPVTMTLDEVEAVLAYVAGMDPANLGAPLIHQ